MGKIVIIISMLADKLFLSQLDFSIFSQYQNQIKILICSKWSALLMSASLIIVVINALTLHNTRLA